MGHRVLLLATEIYGGHGGIALYNRDIAEALNDMPEIDEVVALTRNILFAPENVPEKVRFDPRSAGGKLNYLFTAGAIGFQKFDLIICGHINLMPLAVPLSAFYRCPLVLMTYGIEVWRQTYLFARYWLRKADAVWTISLISRDRMNAWANLPETRYVLLPNAIHLERYGLKDKRTDLLRRYNLFGNTVLLTLARLPGAERYKGVDEILEVLPALLQENPTIKYVVAGDGDDRARLESKARALGLADRVIFTGMVKESDKADIFRLADAFVMPGRGEGFGFVFLEALACGIPVVGSKIDGSREALRDGMLGELVDPDDPESIKTGILRALVAPKGIPQGLSYFAWQSFAQRVSSAVLSIII